MIKDDIGIIEYSQGWEYQKQIFETVCQGGRERLILCEHPHVYTLGRSGKTDNILVDNTFLESIGATFFRTDRGGDITYHGAGQIVGYPILRLEQHALSLKEYIYLVEECIIKVLQQHNIVGYRLKGATGVWVKEDGRENKICAIGVKASRYVTMHGFALNVNTDLNYFNYINPCGFVDKGVTSIKQLTGCFIDPNPIKSSLYDLFEHLIGER